MKIPKLNKSVAIDIIVVLFMVLFLYAAIVKLFDYDFFKLNIGRSPLIMQYKDILAWFVPTIEIIAALMLFIPRLRQAGLLLAFSIMFAFTAYIFFILNFSPTIPCSCGGVLQKMGWMEHLIFNIAFTILAVVGIFLQKNVSRSQSSVSVSQSVQP